MSNPWDQIENAFENLYNEPIIQDGIKEAEKEYQEQQQQGYTDKIDTTPIIDGFKTGFIPVALIGSGIVGIALTFELIRNIL